MKNSILFQFTTASLVVITAHCLLFLTNLLEGELKFAIVLDVAIFVIFFSSLLIIIPGLEKAKDTFALRFLGLTTIQLLTIMSLFVMLIIKKMPDVKFWVFNTMIVVLLLLIIQSVLLVKSLNSSK